MLHFEPINKLNIENSGYWYMMLHFFFILGLNTNALNWLYAYFRSSMICLIQQGRISEYEKTLRFVWVSVCSWSFVHVYVKLFYHIISFFYVIVSGFFFLVESWTYFIQKAISKQSWSWLSAKPSNVSYSN